MLYMPVFGSRLRYSPGLFPDIGVPDYIIQSELE
jgi:hypothetical protein